MTEDDDVADRQVDDGYVARQGHDGKAEAEAGHRGCQTPLLHPKLGVWEQEFFGFDVAVRAAANKRKLYF